jgi:hypothetical protein
MISNNIDRFSQIFDCVPSIIEEAKYKIACAIDNTMVQSYRRIGKDIIRQGTQMTRIRRIYTDLCVSVSSAQSVFYIKNNKPQIHSPLAELSVCYAKRCAGNADECKSIVITHRKGREERKAEVQNSLRSLRLIDFHGIPTAQGNKAIGVFETGFTGYTGCISLNPVMWLKIEKPQINADERRFVISTHRKGREERKAEEEKSLRPLRLMDFYGIPTAQGNKAIGVFETGFTGSTGCVLSFDPVMWSRMEKPQINADERRYKFNNSINIFQPAPTNSNPQCQTRSPEVCT